MNDDRPLAPATRAVTAGRNYQGNSLATPLWGTSTWQTNGLDDTQQRATRLRADEFYSRYANPTVRAFEDAIAELEGAEGALAFGSGMGALASTVLALCSAGDHIVAQRQIYAGTSAFLSGPCARFGIEVDLRRRTGPGRVRRGGAARSHDAGDRRDTVESRVSTSSISPTSPTTVRGPFILVDATFSTPIGIQPIRHGAHLSLHSATKGISGQNDSTLGVVSGERDLLDAIWAYGVLHGASASPVRRAQRLEGRAHARPADAGPG